MAHKEVMHQAIDALLLPTMKTQQMLIQRDEAIIALRRALEQAEPAAPTNEKLLLAAGYVKREAALEQPEQEPVGEVLNERGEIDYISYVPPVGTSVYTAPPAAQRPWVELTDNEITRQAVQRGQRLQSTFVAGMYAAQRILKEKNT
jgi:hypothetical protein